MLFVTLMPHLNAKERPENHVHTSVPKAGPQGGLSSDLVGKSGGPGTAFVYTLYTVGY